MGIGSVMNPAEAIVLELGELMDAEDVFYPVSFAGDSRAATELLGGNVKFASVLRGGVNNLIESGEIRQLFSGTYERMKSYPDIPAVTEFGFWGDNKPYSDYSYMNNFVIGPKGIPDDVVDWMAQTWKAAMLSDEFLKLAAEWCVNVDPITGPGVSKAARDTVDSYKEYIDRFYKN